MSSIEASTHKMIRTISFTAYASAKYGERLNKKYAAKKLVVTDKVLTIRLAVLKYARIK